MEHSAATANPSEPPPPRPSRSAIVRAVAYAVALPLIVVAACDLRRPEPALIGCLAIGLGLAAALLLTNAGRLARVWLARSRTVRLTDVLVWNVVFTLLGLELLLAMGDLVISHPLLTAPNARSRERIANQRLPPYAVECGSRTNAGGYNDSDWGIKPPGTLRVAALGDSFAFGVVGYERNFLTLLEPLLSEAVGKPVEILNLGIPATEPNDYLYVLNDEGLALDPDAVLVCLFTGNDFVPVRSGSRLRASNWRVFAVADRLWRLAREAQRAPAANVDSETGALGKRPVSPKGFSEEAYLELATTYVEVVRQQPSPRVQRAVRECLAVLDAITRLAAPRPVMIAVFPNELQVNADLRERVIKAAQLDPTTLDLDYPWRLVRDHFLWRSDVRVFDLRPALVSAEAEELTYEPRDSHWNARGNAIVSEALAAPMADWLRPLAVAPPPPGP